MPTRLSEAKRLANAVFFEKMFHQLKEGGIWEGDNGMMTKNGDFFRADIETYQYLTQIVNLSWLNRRVILFMNLAE